MNPDPDRHRAERTDQINQAGRHPQDRSLVEQFSSDWRPKDGQDPRTWQYTSNIDKLKLATHANLRRGATPGHPATAVWQVGEISDGGSAADQSPDGTDRVRVLALRPPICGSS